MERFNVVVIGAGSAGLVVAAGCAGLGARVALVEAGLMGGECLNTGCIPSKTLIRSARTIRLKSLAVHGVAASPVPTHWQDLKARIREVTDAIAPHDSVQRFRSLGVEVFQGRAALRSGTRVHVRLNEGGEVTLEGKRLVIATGSKPFVPRIPGLAESGYLTNETVFDLPAQPHRLLVLGGGPIGVELGQTFARLGTQVTVAESLPRLLPNEEEEASHELEAALRADGVQVWTGARITHVENAGAARRVEVQFGTGPARTLEVDSILVAAGRVPNVGSLGLEAAGVIHDLRGILVNHLQRTSCPTVYACGDVAGPYRFTHMANQQARVVIQNVLFPLRAKMDYRVVPWCTFTDPEVARVGLSEREAQELRIPYRVLRVSLADNDRAVCDGETRGLLKLLTPPRSDAILGATLVGAHAGELIHEIVLAMKAGLRLRHLSNTVHIYPTLAEVFRRAGDESRKAGFTPGLKRLVSAYLRWRRA